MINFINFFLLCLFVSSVLSQNYKPVDNFLVNCGASSNATDADGRKWTTDVGTNFFSSSSNSDASPAATQSPDISQIPYMTARIFESEFTYTFPISPGRRFIRLYFYPNSYNQFNTSNSIFSVSAGPYTLLHNFSAYQTAQAINFDYLIKEYLVNLDTNSLNITFTPSSNYSNTFAFVNGIEVASLPYIYDDPSSSIVGQTSTFSIDNSTALENVYRINVGGNVISPTKDTGLYRTWFGDTPYIYGAGIGVPDVLDQGLSISYPSSLPSYVAPVDVYSTARSMGPDPNVNLNYNLTWLFSVDSGFFYMVRLHFCEVFSNISKSNQRVFDVYLNNQTAVSGADVVGWATGNGIPVIKDYVLYVQGEQQQDLWLALHPDTSSKPTLLLDSLWSAQKTNLLASFQTFQPCLTTTTTKKTRCATPSNRIMVELAAMEDPKTTTAPKWEQMPTTIGWSATATTILVGTEVLTPQPHTVVWATTRMVNTRGQKRCACLRLSL